MQTIQQNLDNPANPPLSSKHHKSRSRSRSHSKDRKKYDKHHKKHKHSSKHQHQHHHNHNSSSSERDSHRSKERRMKIKDSENNDSVKIKKIEDLKNDDEIPKKSNIFGEEDQQKPTENLGPSIEIQLPMPASIPPIITKIDEMREKSIEIKPEIVPLTKSEPTKILENVKINENIVDMDIEENNEIPKIVEPIPVIATQEKKADILEVKFEDVKPETKSEAGIFYENRLKIDSEKEEVKKINTEAEIIKRQQYFKMLELEREKCVDNNKPKVMEEQKNIIRDPSELIEKQENDMFDMFASESPVGEAAIVNTVQFEETCDDPDGYYKASIGEIIKNYKVIAILGRGVFGSVVKAINVNNEQQEVAIKIVRSRDIYRISGERERDVLKILNENDTKNKKYIIRMLESFDHMKHLCIVLEALDANLRETLNKFGKNIGISLPVVQFYAKQLFVALHFMKKYKIIHADLKPDNIMVAKDGKHMKLVDFGSALFSEECGITEYLVSRYYRAPEIILGNQYSYPIDVWSAMVSLYEMYTGKVLFPGETNNDMLRLIMRVKGKFANRLIKKAQFASRHFDEQGVFLRSKYDPIAKQVFF